MAQYDPALLEKSVSRLLSKARSIAILYGLLGMSVGLLGGKYLDAFTGIAGMTVLAPLPLGLVAYALGRERAFHLRLEAHNTLCRLRLADAIRELLTSSKRQDFVSAPRSGPEAVVIDATGTE